MTQNDEYSFGFLSKLNLFRDISTKLTNVDSGLHAPL
jgi:hypothetical protein